MATFCSSLDYRMVCNLFAIGFYKPYAGISKPPTAVSQLQAPALNSRDLKSAAISDSLRLLEWHKVVDLVSSFSGTHLGREATKAQLSSTIELTYEESKIRLEETSAAMELIKCGSGMLNFSGIDDILVKSAINQACKGFPVTGLEAIAIVSLIEFTENLQATVEAAVKEKPGWLNRCMPLYEMVMNASVCHSLVKMVEQVINEDGSVKDSASYELRQGRERVRILERKLYQLMEKLARNDKNDSLSLEVCNINGRWCIKSMSNQPAKIDGLLLSSGLGAGDLIEPIAALPLNDELQHARALVAEAEKDVLSQLTNKITIELGSLQSLLDMITQLDAVDLLGKKWDIFPKNALSFSPMKLPFFFFTQSMYNHC
ncbi:hypothetical protein HPP92_007179 [Vanilla planifolia]|uniref:Uncharacterized protein n=1 Tax=Vanilla planifolia TaxID=51239 RepID=A0A835VBM1_VANPL|nr:hypothetical protein HPP92_007179 [Vanilla planifolia]